MAQPPDEPRTEPVASTSALRPPDAPSAAKRPRLRFSSPGAPADSRASPANPARRPIQFGGQPPPRACAPARARLTVCSERQHSTRSPQSQALRRLRNAPYSPSARCPSRCRLAGPSPSPAPLECARAWLDRGLSSLPIHPGRRSRSLTRPSVRRFVCPACNRDCADCDLPTTRQRSTRPSPVLRSQPASQTSSRSHPSPSRRLAPRRRSDSGCTGHRASSRPRSRRRPSRSARRRSLARCRHDGRTTKACGCWKASRAHRRSRARGTRARRASGVRGRRAQSTRCACPFYILPIESYSD